MDKVSMPYLFLFPRYQTKYVINLNQPLKHVNRKKKRGRQKYKNWNISGKK